MAVDFFFSFAFEMFQGRHNASIILRLTITGIWWIYLDMGMI